MKGDVYQRVSDVVDFLIYSKVALDKKDLSQKLGYNASSFSQIVNGRVSVSEKFIEKLSAFAPNINKNWLLTGEGEMLKVPATISVYDENTAKSMSKKSNIDISVVPAEVIEEIKEEAIEDAEKRLIEQISIPIVPSEIINKTDVNIRQFIEKKGHNLKQFDPREITNGSIGSKEIIDTSMWPTFSPGDYIFFTFLPDKRMVTDGKTYLFDFNERPTMVRKVKVEGDKLRLIAENPDYGDIITSFDQIFNIADIVGMFRHFFGDQHTKVEALRRHKEDQIDTLIHEIRENGKRTDRMMEQNIELMQKLMEKLL